LEFRRVLFRSLSPYRPTASFAPMGSPPRPTVAAGSGGAPPARSGPGREPARGGPVDGQEADQSWSSALASSSTFTSLHVTTRTDLTKRAERYTSHTHASASRSSKYTSPAAERTCRSTWFAR